MDKENKRAEESNSTPQESLEQQLFHKNLEQDQPTSGFSKNKKKKLIMIVSCIVLVAVIIVTLFLTGVFAGKKQDGNEYIWAIYNLITKQDTADISDKTQIELGDRMIGEQYEIEGNAILKSDILKTFGLPIDTITANYSVKNDTENLGIKLKAFGLIELGAYVVGDTAAIDIMGQAVRLPIDLSILQFGMDNKTTEALFAELAMCVPNDIATMQSATVYSLIEEREISVEAFVMELDSKEIKFIVHELASRLENKPELKKGLKDFIKKVSGTGNSILPGTFDLNDFVENMAEYTADEDFGLNITLYKSDGKYIGFNIEILQSRAAVDVEYMLTYSENTEFSSIALSGADFSLELHSEIEFNDKISKPYIVITLDLPNGDLEETYSLIIDGQAEVNKNGKDEYSLEANYDLTLDLGSILSNEGIDDPLKVGFETTAEIIFGELQTLRESSDWNKIFDSEWKEFNELGKVFSDMFDNLRSLTG